MIKDDQPQPNQTKQRDYEHLLYMLNIRLSENPETLLRICAELGIR